MALTRKVLVNQPVDYRIAALVYFVKKLEAQGLVKFVGAVSDEQLLAHADAFWDAQHGEDD